MTTKRKKTPRTATRAKRRLRLVAPKVRVRSSDAGEITSKPMLLGYARVSTVDQNLALQRDALTEAGCTKIFTEQMSGAVTDRPALHDALEFARSGDTLIVWKLEPPGAVDEAVDRDRRDPAVEGHRVSQSDRSPRHDDRAGAAGFSHVWRAGRIRAQLDPRAHPSRSCCCSARRPEGGRPPKLTDDDIEAAKAMLANPDIGVTQIAHRLGVSPATLYRYIPAARTANTPGV